MTVADAGLSLAGKLDLKRGMRVWFRHMPDDVRVEIERCDPGHEEQAAASDGLQAAIIFATDTIQLQQEVKALSPLLATNGFIWIAISNNLSEMETDDSQSVIQAIAAAIGLIEVKTVALTDYWSGLKFAFPRRELLRGVSG